MKTLLLFLVLSIGNNTPPVITGCRIEPEKKQYFFWDLYEAKDAKDIPIIKGRAYYPHEIFKRKEL